MMRVLGLVGLVGLLAVPLLAVPTTMVNYKKAAQPREVIDINDAINLLSIFDNLFIDGNDDIVITVPHEDGDGEELVDAVGEEEDVAVVVIQLVEETEEGILDSFLFEEDVEWGVCTRRCKTFRVRHCQMPLLCGRQERREEALCYVPGTDCENKVKEQLASEGYLVIGVEEASPDDEEDPSYVPDYPDAENNIVGDYYDYGWSDYVAASEDRRRQEAEGAAAEDGDNEDEVEEVAEAEDAPEEEAPDYELPEDSDDEDDPDWTPGADDLAILEEDGETMDGLLGGGEEGNEEDENSEEDPDWTPGAEDYAIEREDEAMDATEEGNDEVADLDGEDEDANEEGEDAEDAEGDASEDGNDDENEESEDEDSSISSSSNSTSEAIVLPLNCGQRIVKGSNELFRIIGGREADHGSWPWTVAILDETKDYKCAGTLIAPRWVLTAAHCLSSNLYVSMGEHHLEEEEEEDAKIELKVKLMFPHPSYSGRRGDGFDGDIALLKLPEDVKYSKHILPACLPTKESIPPMRSKCVIAGWGLKDDDGWEGSPTLNWARVPIVTKQACKEAHPSLTITKNMFCAGYKFGTVDTCQGDSGGPVVCDESSEQWTVHGVTSFGDGCAQAGKPGVYTRVVNYIQWIHKVIQ